MSCLHPPNLTANYQAYAEELRNNPSTKNVTPSAEPAVENVPVAEAVAQDEPTVAPAAEPVAETPTAYPGVTDEQIQQAIDDMAKAENPAAGLTDEQLLTLVNGDDILEKKVVNESGEQKPVYSGGAGDYSSGQKDGEATKGYRTRYSSNDRFGTVGELLENNGKAEDAVSRKVSLSQFEEENAKAGRPLVKFGGKRKNCCYMGQK